MTSCSRLPVFLRGRRSALVTVLALLLLALPLPRDGARVLAADDACPEQNSTYQQACILPPNVGVNSYLSSADDVDFFRIEVLDFGATVNVELTQAPRPYRMTIRDWEGGQIAAAGPLPNDDIERTVQFKPKAPGSYYVLIDPLFDGDDAVSPSEPYTLMYKPVYPGPTPKVIYSADFRQPSREFAGTKEWGSYSTKDGKYQVELLNGGQPGSAAVAVAWWPDSYRDFTMVADVRLTAVGQDAGFAIGFRGLPHDASEKLREDQVDLRSAYMVLASTGTLQLELLRLVDDKPDVLMPWKAIRSMRTSDQINHVVVRSIGSQHLVNINGEEVLNLQDPSLQEGRLILGALSFGEPVTVIYDNLLVISPS